MRTVRENQGNAAKKTVTEVKNIFIKTINRLGMAEKESVMWEIGEKKFQILKCKRERE